MLGFLACGAVVRREAYLAAGGFDDVVFFMGEEERLALDLATLGWGLAYVDEVVAHHHPSPTRDSSSGRPARPQPAAHDAAAPAVARGAARRAGRPARRRRRLAGGAAGAPAAAAARSRRRRGCPPHVEAACAGCWTTESAPAQRATAG